MSFSINYAIMWKCATGLFSFHDVHVYVAILQRADEL